MKKRRRKSIVVFFSMFLILLSLLTGCSLEDDSSSSIMYPTVKQDVYVYDQGNFISDDAEHSMNELLVQLEHQTTIEFAVITIPSLNNMTIEDYAYDLGNGLGIGKEEDDNGILLLISREDSKVRLEIGKGLQGIITDSISGRILDNFFVPYRDEDKYDEASSNTVQAVINCLANSEEYEISIEGINSNVVLEEEEEIPTIYVVIGIIIIVLALILLEFVTGHLFGDGFGDGIVFIILDAMIDSGGSGGGGSGGHFGGGGFSGGGASR